MQPTGSESTAGIEASAEATIAAAAITLETVQAAIETESGAAEDRQEELLAEVRRCLARLETLSTSMERGAESPSLQQLLIQTGQIQQSLEMLQADLAALREESEESIESNQEPSEEDLAEAKSALAAAADTGHQNDGPPPQSGPKSSSKSSETNPQKSNQSAIPAASKKRHYVKI